MGTFYVSTEKKDWLEFVSKGQIPPWWKPVAENNIVKGGAAFIEDRAVGNTTAAWKDSVISYMALGTSSATNQGLQGPGEVGDLLVTGSWQGSSKLDWKLTAEIDEIGGGCRSPITFTRTGDVMTMSALFTDAQINVGTTACMIREWGLFLSDTIPEESPFDAELEMPNAMIARAVKMAKNPGDPNYYTDSHELKNQDGRDIEFFYMFRVK